MLTKKYETYIGNIPVEVKSPENSLTRETAGA